MKQGVCTVIATTITVGISRLPTADEVLKLGQVFAVFAGGALSIAMLIYYVMKTIREGREVTVELAKIAHTNAAAIETQSHVLEGTKQATIDRDTLSRRMNDEHLRDDES